MKAAREAEERIEHLLGLRGVGSHPIVNISGCLRDGRLLDGLDHPVRARAPTSHHLGHCAVDRVQQHGRVVPLPPSHAHPQRVALPYTSAQRQDELIRH